MHVQSVVRADVRGGVHGHDLVHMLFLYIDKKTTANAARHSAAPKISTVFALHS